MIRLLQVPVAALIGALTGIVAMVLVQSHLGPAPAQPSPQGPAAFEVRPPALPPADPTTDRRLRALEMQLREPSSSGTAKEDAPPRPVEQDKHAAADHARQVFAQRLADHEASTRDAHWAAPKEHAIAEAMGQLASDGHQSFSVVHVDCRTTTCVARLQWPDEATAHAEIRNLMQNADVDCARTVTLPVASSATGSYQASLLFDCAPSTD